MSGLPKTPAKPSTPVSGAGQATPESYGKKSQVSTKQITGYWKDPEREKEDAEAQKQEEKCQKKFSGPVLSLDDHEDLVATLTNRAAPSQVSQPPSVTSKAPSVSSKGWGSDSCSVSSNQDTGDLLFYWVSLTIPFYHVFKF